MHIGVIIAIVVVLVAIFAVVLMYVFSGPDEPTTSTTTHTTVPITTTVPVTDTTTGAQTTIPVTTDAPVTTTTTVQPPTFADGSIIRSPDGKIFVVHGGKRYHFTAVSYAACGSPKFTNYPQATVDAFPSGPIQVPSCATKSADASAARSVLTSAGY